MQLLPSYCEDRSPPGEKKLFSLLERADRDWVVVHSLDLAPYNRNRRTEIDFLIIMPSKGIVCVEVKSHKNVYLDKKGWQPGTLQYRDPFVQARDGSSAFRRRIIDAFGAKYRSVPILPLVMFPCSRVEINSNVSVKSWDFIDKRSFDKADAHELLPHEIQRYFMTAIDQDPDLSVMRRELTAEEIDEIVLFCRPIRKRIPEFSEELLESKNRLDSILRAQQAPVMKLVELNEKVLVTGAAGTGKSLIGVEVAKIKAGEGKRVAYLCYNRLIGKWAARELQKTARPNLVAGPIYQVLFQIADIQPPQHPDSDWWENEAPIQILDKLTSLELRGIAQFDYIVVDELQDILARPMLWECLKGLFVDGVSNSSFLFLGDFELQSLSVDKEIIDASLTEISNISTNWVLSENCRNYKAIGDATLLLSGFEKKPWSGFMRAGGGVGSWKIKTYKDPGDQQDKIEQLISRLLTEGFNPTDITVLSFNPHRSSIYENLKNSEHGIVSAENFESAGVRYSTVKKFKGLEAKIVILSDVFFSPNEIDYQRRLFYTAMTRATERLFIFCKETSKDSLISWMDS